MNVKGNRYIRTVISRFGLLSALGVGLLTASACDNPPGLPSAADPVRLHTLNLTPNPVAFEPTDGVRDTTVELSVSVSADGVPDAAPVFHWYVAGVAGAPETVALTYNNGTDRWEALVPLELTTTTLAEYRTYVLVPGSAASNRVEAVLPVQGFTAGVPLLESVQAPATVRIPASGSQPFSLAATVSHPNGLSALFRVVVSIRGGNGQALPGSPFTLFDDGGGASGDPTAGDGTFTRRFTVASTNMPDTYTLRFWALDKAGQSSDTLSATMRFER